MRCTLTEPCPENGADFLSFSALFAVPALLAFLAALLLVVAIKQDLNPGPRSDGQMIAACCATFAAFSIFHPIQVYLMRRWMRTGKPTLKG